jgi:hypothetical protein
MKGIVREVLKHTNDQFVFWRATEVCYEQTNSRSGSLHADDYFDPLEEACLAWPYNPDFDSDRYYDHKNQLLVNEDHAAASQEQVGHRYNRQSWRDFWFGVLNNASNDSTLFYPPLSPHCKHLELSVPWYLFRTSDAASSGQNNEDVEGSMASSTNPQQGNRFDILSNGKQEVVQMLHMHLGKDCFKEGD